MPHATAVHPNSTLTPTGRLKMVERHIDDGLPIAHVAREFRVSWDTVSKWVTRYRDHGEAGLVDHPSTPRHWPTATRESVVERIEALRRQLKWSARRIHLHLITGGIDPLPQQHGLATGEIHPPVRISLRTVGRWLARRGISRLRDLTPNGENLRTTPSVIEAEHPGAMVHLDVKKVGTIPDGGGHKIHGRGSSKAKASKRGSGARVGYTYLHSAV
ncbi:helix-turn-helix domain-containing protein, partial [Nesterenkonia sp. PF2B19]|uniref:helix-turn-helix domain-containing protein n=1 Tax=Nesterenkonia sp. PF2B19 TaxID=1881858 RepID=UPI000A24F0DB